MRVKRFLAEHKLIVATAVIVCVAAVALSAVNVYADSHFARGTKVNGIDVSGMGVKELQQRINAYALEVTQRQVDEQSREETLFKEKINGAEIALQMGDDKPLYDILNAQSLLTFLLGESEQYEIGQGLSYDQALLEKAVGRLKGVVNTDGTEAINATISDYTEESGYEIVEEKPGDILDEEATLEVVTEAVSSLKQSVDLTKKDCYRKADLTSESEVLAEALEEMNRYVGTKITYEFGDDTVVLDGAKINKWLKVSDDGRISIREKKVAAFVESLRKKYDTIFTNRKFKTAYGDTVMVYGGDYGWWMDTDKETTKLMSLIKKGAVKKRKPEYRQEAVCYGKQDYGDSYVEVDLTGQHVYVTKKGKVVLDSDCVTGNESRGFATPAGTYSITYKQRKATLRGENYATPVEYWMPFNGGVGLHDANWRSQFGGTLYRTSGSHGCVNLPPSVAERIFSLVEKGMPVICYYQTDIVSKSTDKPKQTTDPKVTRKPRATIKPKVTKKPTKTTKPKVTKKPKKTTKPKETKKPTKTTKPKATKKPTKTTKPKKTAKPKVTKKPKKTAKPKATKKPKKTAKPKVTKKPKKTTKPKKQT